MRFILLAALLTLLHTGCGREEGDSTTIAESVYADDTSPTSGPVDPRYPNADYENNRITSNDGKQVFTIPRPGEPNYADWLRMMQYRPYRTAGAIPYDPDWRDLERGYRRAAVVELGLKNAYASMDTLAEAVVFALVNRDRTLLEPTRIIAQEFETICWPSFPQGRPYTRITWRDAWGMQDRSSHSGIVDLLSEFGGLPLEFVRIEANETKAYPPNFRIHSGIRLYVRNTDSGELLEILGLQSIIERKDRFKAFMYDD